MTGAIIGVIGFFFGAATGLILGGIAAAAARAEERAQDAALRELVVRDYHVIRDDFGVEHLIPITAERSPDSG